LANDNRWEHHFTDFLALSWRDVSSKVGNKRGSFSDGFHCGADSFANSCNSFPS
jgi:hypothetical protein